MRALIIAAGICVAATAASAEMNTNAATGGNHVMANGCVYGPSPSGAAHTMSLIYTQNGTTARCAMTVTRSPASAATQTRPAPRLDAPQLAFASAPGSGLDVGYVVGVFR